MGALPGRERPSKEDALPTPEMARQLVSMPIDDAGPLIQQINGFFGIDVVDNYGNALEPKHGELVQVHGRGRETQALYEFALSFYHAIRGWQRYGDAQKERARSETDLSRRSALAARMRL